MHISVLSYKTILRRLAKNRIRKTPHWDFVLLMTINGVALISNFDFLISFIVLKPIIKCSHSFFILFPGPINFSTVSGSEETRGELGGEVSGPDDITESLFPLTEDSGPRYVESSLLRGQAQEAQAGGDRDRVSFGE